jgi:hypothetical protein
MANSLKSLIDRFSIPVFTHRLLSNQSIRSQAGMIPWQHSLRRFAGAASVLAATSFHGQTLAPIQTFPLRDVSGLITPTVKTEAVTYQGRKCVRITMDGDDRDGLALLPGTDFQDGVVEADIALRSAMPPGVRFPGFIGIGFRVHRNASHYELFYLRPGNSDSPDQLMHNHAVQYSSEPDYGWYRLRREWPAVYESHAELAKETWTHLRIEVTGRSAKLYLNGSPQPSLVVDGLKGEDLHGAVGLWSFTGEEAYFSNVRITPATPQDLKNTSDIAGRWQMRYGSDVGGMSAQMELHRDGDKVTGTWTGHLGENRAITGSWRNGYVELSFAGDWPKEMGRGTPGPVNVFLAGWVDGNAAQGRMRAEARSDCTWTAERKE